MEKSQRTNELLVAGVKSYPEALIAIDEFRRVLLGTVRETVEHNLKSIATAMGIKLSASEIQKRLRPTESEVGRDNAAIGVTIRRDAEGWRQYYQFYWEPDSSFSFLASVWFREVDATSTSTAVNKVKCRYTVGFEDNEVFMLRRVTTGEIGRVKDVLGTFMREWATFWKRVGGLKRLKSMR